jgi:hypothetical protein
LNFIAHAVIAIAVVLIGGLVSSETAGNPEAASIMRFSFGIATLVAQGWLFFAALYLRSRSAKRFDMTVAAETLVALGVFSLITGIVLAVIATPSAHITIGSSTLPELEPLLIPFAEGLFASAVAPLLSTLLRQIEVLKYAPYPESDSSGKELNRLRREADSAAEALNKITTATETASKNVATFAEATKSVVGGLNDVAKNIKDAKGMIPAALTVVASGIDSSRSGVMASFETTADNIRTGGNQVSVAFDTTAGNIRTSSAQVSAAFAATSSALGDFTTKAASSTETTKNLALELEGLSKEAQTTTGILKRLQQLIDSVTDFIRPEKT